MASRKVGAVVTNESFLTLHVLLLFPGYKVGSGKQCHVHALSHRSKYMSLMLGKVQNLQTCQKELHDACPFCVDRNSCLISDLMTHVMKAWSLIFFLRTAAAVRSAAISCLWALLQSNLLSLQDAGQIMKDLLTQVHKLWIYYYISF